MKLNMIRRDQSRDPDGSWAWCAVFVANEPIADRDEDFESQVLRECEENGIRIRSEGHGGAGEPFANPPWVWVIGQTIIVSQTGGLDV